ncbi:DUF4271 domain-containing protein [Psychroflexus maritimus]|uniref:DUF4271 domain-containing protein n=1 Tax=Psychroflexus maritimus TaxID=2714865 RepID=A0A967AF81_9FLAO|nr:DUF4271 domain-containing protein [Psychroflexus maritimus]NGZ90458.1 DUF4271 domain-containing protein [Psychroflexus maritimus]
MNNVPFNFIIDLINIFTFAVLVFVKLRNTSYFYSFIQLFWKPRFVHQNLKEKNKAYGLQLTFYILTGLHFGLLISCFLIEFNCIDFTNFWSILLICTSFILMFIGLRFVSINLIGYVFKLKDYATYLAYYKFNKAIYWFFIFYLGQILLNYSPLNPQFLAITIGSVGAIYLLISIIDFQLRFQNEIIRHWYYFILYLCTLEIAPYIILYKAISESVN